MSLSTTGKLVLKDGAILAIIGSSGVWTEFIEPFLSFVALATAALAGVIKLVIVFEQRRQQKKGSGNDE